MIGTCRKCGGLISSLKVCADDSTGPDAVEVGLDFMQAVRAHWTQLHEPPDYAEAEVAGQLAAFFPYLAGVDPAAKQMGVLGLACEVLRGHVFGIGFNASTGKLGARPADAGGPVGSDIVLG